jgi:S-adenosylmethionine:tRNA-ribosyltransferase-isomerase (queuine synthetase)
MVFSTKICCAIFWSKKTKEVQKGGYKKIQKFMPSNASLVRNQTSYCLFIKASLRKKCKTHKNVEIFFKGKC